jgi:hypothetical protein
VDILLRTSWAGTLAALTGVVLYNKNNTSPTKKMEEDRANRLTTKIRVLANRIATLNHRGGYPREILQLQVARDCFERALQKHSNKITVHHT